ncbi:hypothetical protein [Nocardia sp. XZ_19_385]|uniref:hypothetical protein n=1 Tax=Nocardia sp. XZ_19_385 TaxID=2769488 RepID=UPI00188E0EAE|nr:hypothetical protein [Nocardia sp. XZ_19_385]
MTTINEARVLAALLAGRTPLSLPGLASVTHLEVKMIRKSLASLTSSGLVEQTGTEPEQTWKLTTLARRLLETAIGRAALDVPAMERHVTVGMTIEEFSGGGPGAGS